MRCCDGSAPAVVETVGGTSVFFDRFSNCIDVLSLLTPSRHPQEQAGSMISFRANAEHSPSLDRCRDRVVAFHMGKAHQRFTKHVRLILLFFPPNFSHSPDEATDLCVCACAPPAWYICAKRGCDVVPFCARLSRATYARYDSARHSFGTCAGRSRTSVARWRVAHTSDDLCGRSSKRGFFPLLPRSVFFA